MFTGVVLPSICFAISLPIQPEWQSGKLDDYAQLLLAHRPSSPLYPFLLYSMTCMTLLVFAPGRFIQSFVVRFGVYTGVLLALAYWSIFVMAMAANASPFAAVAIAALPSFMAVFIPWAVGWLILFLWREFRLFRELAAIFLVILPLVLLGPMLVSAAIGEGPRFLVGVLLGPCILCLFCATPWAVASYGAMSIYASRHSGVKRMRFSLGRLMGVVTWSAAFLGAWRTSFLWMLEEYAKLPTEPPHDCYVSTAAARGHRRLVAAEDQTDPSGRVVRVNDQMRYLKAAELVLAGVNPPVHRVCRRAYDRIGPPLARMFVHPLLADVAYLSLKPAEWLCRAGLAVLFPGSGGLIRSIYRPAPDRPPAYPSDS